jgi:hypothetical protein
LAKRLVGSGAMQNHREKTPDASAENKNKKRRDHI